METAPAPEAGLPLMDPRRLISPPPPAPRPRAHRALEGARGPRARRRSAYCEAASSADLVSTPAWPGSTANGGTNMAPGALAVFVSPLPATYTQTHIAALTCAPAVTQPGPSPPGKAWLLGSRSSPARLRPRLAQAWAASRPRHIWLLAKPGEAAARRLPGGGAARRPEHAQWVGPAPGARRKRSLCSRRLRWGMRYRLAWLLHPALPRTFRSVLGARLPPPERLSG